MASFSSVPGFGAAARGDVAGSRVEASSTATAVRGTEAAMSDWWHVAQVSTPALGTAAMCLGLRRYARAVLWNVLLKLMGVRAPERRALAVSAARIDLGVDRAARPGRRRRPSPGAPGAAPAPSRSCRTVGASRL